MTAETFAAFLIRVYPRKSAALLIAEIAVYLLRRHSQIPHQE
jgi:hypothetical protein